MFSDDPYIYPSECFWNEEPKGATEGYYVMSVRLQGVTAHASSIQTYTDEWLEAMLEDAGFIEIGLYNSFLGSTKESDEGFHVTLSARNVSTFRAGAREVSKILSPNKIRGSFIGLLQIGQPHACRSGFLRISVSVSRSRTLFLFLDIFTPHRQSIPCAQVLPRGPRLGSTPLVTFVQ